MKRRCDYDAAMHRELGLCIENDYPSYQRQQLLAKNYERKMKRGVFNKEKAILGIHNLIVTPYARKYQKEYHVKIGSNERKGVAKGIYRYMEREMLPQKKGKPFW